MQLFSADTTIFKEKKIALKNIKKMPLKIANNRVGQFSVLPTSPTPAHISNSVPHKNGSPRDLYIMTLNVRKVISNNNKKQK